MGLITEDHDGERRLWLVKSYIITVTKARPITLGDSTAVGKPLLFLCVCLP